LGIGKFGISGSNVERVEAGKGDKEKMIDRIDSHPTPIAHTFIEKRSGTERRKIHTMLDPDIDRRKGERRKRDRKNRYLS
jgi:hypothetical protein